MPHQPDTADLARRVMEAAEKATAGEWATHPHFPQYVVPRAASKLLIGGHVDDALDQQQYAQVIVHVRPDRHGRNDPRADAAFIALTRTAAPALAQAVLEKDAEIERLREALKPVAFIGRLSVDRPDGESVMMAVRHFKRAAELMAELEARTALKDT